MVTPFLFLRCWWVAAIEKIMSLLSGRYYWNQTHHACLKILNVPDILIGPIIPLFMSQNQGLIKFILFMMVYIISAIFVWYYFSVTKNYEKIKLLLCFWPYLLNYFLCTNSSPSFWTQLYTIVIASSWNDWDPVDTSHYTIKLCQGFSTSSYKVFIVV